jgi:hypothetical protein
VLGIAAIGLLQHTAGQLESMNLPAFHRESRIRGEEFSVIDIGLLPPLERRGIPAAVLTAKFGYRSRCRAMSSRSFFHAADMP